MVESIKHVILKLVVWIAVLLTFGVTYSAPAQTNNPASTTATEKWVLEQVAKGEEAHLETTFAVDDRKLSGSFIRKLLTNSIPGLKVGQHGVHIYGAVVTDPIDLRDEEIPYNFSLAEVERRQNEIENGSVSLLPGPESLTKLKAEFE